jgi:hypothetical protein
VFDNPRATAERVAAATALYESYRWSEEKRKYLGVYRGLLGDDGAEEAAERSAQPRSGKASLE